MHGYQIKIHHFSKPMQQDRQCTYNGKINRVRVTSLVAKTQQSLPIKLLSHNAAGNNINILTYLLTPWCRVLPEQLTGLQLVKKFPAFHGTRRFITALTSVRHLSLSWASPIQSTCPHPTSWRSILILSTHLRLGLPSGPFRYILLTYLLHGAESFLSS